MNRTLPLGSLEIEGFRAISHLRLPELGRVTLFVGLNNAGKTSLLEAAHLYLHRGKRSLAPLIFELIRDHADYRPRFSSARSKQEVDSADVDAAVAAIEALFHGSFDVHPLEPIRIGPEHLRQDVLTLHAPWSSPPKAPEGNGEEGLESRWLFFAPDSPLLEIQHETNDFSIPLDWFLRQLPVRRVWELSGPVMIPASGLNAVRIRDLWDRVAVSGKEELVESAMRIVAPDLERVLLVGDSGRRSVLARLRDVARPIPLQNLGDGVNRVFGIALAMVQARGGVVLIDEVENGLHFTVQDEVWRAIFTLARELDVQVLATTHSWDSIVGFQYAANISEEEGMLYRLERTPQGRLDAIRFTEEEVEIAAEQRIEIR